MGVNLHTIKLEIPLTKPVAKELTTFWEKIFGEVDLPLHIFLGSEVEDNQNFVYLNRRRNQLAGTCVVTCSRSVPRLGGFGEVASDPDMRRSGIATHLCGQAIDDFRTIGGQALFLGTGNPEAARIYHRLGWRQLANTNVMANITSGDSPEEFFSDYFREIEVHTFVGPATAADRVPIIPLIVTPHDWGVLDANAMGMLSTRYHRQTSCMSLYPKYEAISADGQGSWFSARACGGEVVGLSSARLDGSGSCQIDSFTHKRFANCWRDLVHEAANWGIEQGASRIIARVSVEDEEKTELFRCLGFAVTRNGEDFQIGERPLKSIIMQQA